MGAQSGHVLIHCKHGQSPFAYEGTLKGSQKGTLKGTRMLKRVPSRRVGGCFKGGWPLRVLEGILQECCKDAHRDFIGFEGFLGLTDYPVLQPVSPEP